MSCPTSCASPASYAAGKHTYSNVPKVCTHLLQVLNKTLPRRGAGVVIKYENLRDRARVGTGSVGPPAPPHVCLGCVERVRLQVRRALENPPPPPLLFGASSSRLGRHAAITPANLAVRRRARARNYLCLGVASGRQPPNSAKLAPKWSSLAQLGPGLSNFGQHWSDLGHTWSTLGQLEKLGPVWATWSTSGQFGLNLAAGAWKLSYSKNASRSSFRAVFDIAPVSALQPVRRRAIWRAFFEHCSATPAALCRRILPALFAHFSQGRE